MPTFFIPGDNGWLDCADADEAYGFWTQHLFPFNDIHWETSDLKTVAGPGAEGTSNYIVERSSITRNEGQKRTELFSIYIKDREILFIGLSLPGSGKGNGYEDKLAGRSQLQQDNIDWVESQLFNYSTAPDYGVSGVVIVGHAISSTNLGVRDRLEGITNENPSIPFLMLADNQHYFWQPEVPFYGNDNNRWKIDVDDTVTPLIVSFEPNLFHMSGQMPVTYDRGCDCTTGHRPTQILESVDPCYPYCEAVYNNCPMCSTQTGAATPCVAPFSESVDGVFDFISGRPYNICTGDGIRCSSTNLIYHESLSKTEAMVEVRRKMRGLANDCTSSGWKAKECRANGCDWIGGSCQEPIPTTTAIPQTTTAGTNLVQMTLADGAVDADFSRYLL